MVHNQMTGLRGIGLLAGFTLLSVSVPAVADVKDGVDAWSRGDYAVAVAEWQLPAQQGDPDALFNMGQAYRLGLGVEADAETAEFYYGRAAKGGHIRAADTYGLMLAQSGRMKAALPYLDAAAGRGDPRAQYLLGIAHFNGEGVPKDWVRAYALLTLSNAQGLPQAPAIIAKMDQHIPLTQRQQAAALAMQMEEEAEATRARELGAADLAMAGSAVEGTAPAQMPVGTARVPRPIETAAVAPSSAVEANALVDARDAIRQARQVTGTESPAGAGADYARAPGDVPQPAPRETFVSRPTQVQSSPMSQSRPSAPAPAQASSGPWKLQLGAFGVSGNAERLWESLKSRPELAGKKRLLVPAGRLTKLMAGGFATQAQASAACARLKRVGQVCLVTK